MNYYKRHLGDYARDTGHLTALEHGIYNLLLDWYYINEKPIPHEKAKRIAKANPDETQTVLCEFFSETPEGWKHDRADREIAEYMAKAERNREVGKLGGRPKKTQTVSETEPKRNPSHKPLAIKDQKKDYYVVSSPDGDNCPHSEIIALYHEILPTLPRVRAWTPARQKALRTRWREEPERQTLEWWRGFFGYVAKSDFLTGRTGNGKWTCSLPWLLKAENFAKVIEGHYENREAA